MDRVVVLATPAEVSRALALGTPAAIASELRAARARLGWVTRRLHEAERLAYGLCEHERLRDLLGDFSRRA